MGESNEISLEILKILQEIRKDVKDLKSELANHTENIAQLNQRVDILEEENRELKKKVQDTQSEAKKNNIVIFGIKEEEEETDITSQVLTVLNHKLGIHLENSDIDNIYRIGTKETKKQRAIILKFVRNTTKQEIFHNIGKLKGTGVTIAHDLSPEEREVQKVLYNHYKSAKKHKKQTKIVGKKLIINGKTFSYEDLKDKERQGEDTVYETEQSKQPIATEKSITTRYRNKPTRSGETSTKSANK